jgi:hypothetical protein
MMFTFRENAAFNVAVIYFIWSVELTSATSLIDTFTMCVRPIGLRRPIAQRLAAITQERPAVATSHIASLMASSLKLSSIDLG